MSPDEKADLVFPPHDAGLARSTPPAGHVVIGEWSLASSEQLSTVRAQISACLAREGEPTGEGLTETPEKLVLIASELATNALRHGEPPTVVRLLADNRSFLLEVVDHDRTSRPVYAGERVLGDGGIGLHLARRLSLAVGWFHDETSKTVWATFPA